MGKTYYCDYCDRSFKDNYEARKKHLSCSQHVNNRIDHYRYFRDPEDILKDETEKIPCKKFMSGGECAFGDSCKFSHFTPSMIYELRRFCAWKNYVKAAKLATEQPKIDEIIHKYFNSPFLRNDTKTFNNPIWNIPLELQNLPNLPPSLWPITAKSIIDSNFATWGH